MTSLRWRTRDSEVTDGCRGRWPAADDVRGKAAVDRVPSPGRRLRRQRRAGRGCVVCWNLTKLPSVNCCIRSVNCCSFPQRAIS